MRLSEVVPRERCYVTRVWGFSPETWGAMGFPKAGAADKWLKRGEAIRVICFVSHHAADHIDESDRGRVLGIYELSPQRVGLEHDEVLESHHLTDPTMRHPDGRFRWPVGLRASRAWRFKNPPRTGQSMPDARALGFDVSTDLVRISDRDFALLDQASYQLEEVGVFGIPFSPKRFSDPIAVPSSVYLFACGKRELLSRLPGWRVGDVLVKVGCTSDVPGRLLSFNNHPLAKIFGLKLAKIAERQVGEVAALAEELALLTLAASIGRPASDEQTEFFFMSDSRLRELQLRLSSVLRVA